MDSRKQHIRLLIDCYEVHLSVDAEEEPMYRAAGALLNSTYKKYAQSRPDWPIAKLWVYAALEIAIDLQAEKKSKDIKPILEKLQELNRHIEENVNNTEKQ